MRRKDPKLSEVKAVLQGLQRIETEDESAETERGGVGQHGRAVAVGAAMIVVTATGILGMALVVGFNARTDTASNPKPAGVARVTAAAPEPKLPAAMLPRLDPVKEREVNAALVDARGLMAKGQVRAAREKLLALADQGSPDAAWDLARAYDPNVLTALPGADASANVKEAERWYRAWYAAAVRDGLVADSVSLERIIGTMRQ
ncbi:MAG: hypothetical protein J2P50_07835 [Hyphomicrobiaceae bacterium]|nr:hypothetical protein [Hyphomicrobiaceae bacterium]